MMNFTPLTFDAPASPETQVRSPAEPFVSDIQYRISAERVSPPSQEYLRSCQWEIGEKRSAERYAPTHNHIGIGVVAPCQGFVHWRLLHDWVEETARKRGGAWHGCRMVVRVYDVTCIEFNGLNAHHIQDHTIGHLAGQMIFHLPRAGTWHLAEVGFLLRNGEFIAGARSQAMAFPPQSPSRHGGSAGLYVNDRLRVQEVGNVWDHDRVLREVRRPRLKSALRLAIFASASPSHETVPGRFVLELAAGQRRLGHEVHVFVPGSGLRPSELDGVHVHRLDVPQTSTPLDWAREYGRAAEAKLRDMPVFDLVHGQDWLTAIPAVGKPSSIVALTSIEATRRNGTPPSPLSLEIEKTERAIARSACAILTPDWLRTKAIDSLGLDPSSVHGFPMEGRLPNEWETPLDLGHVKMGIGIGPLDRMILFVGPLDHGAGVDILLEALPVVLGRAGNARLAFVGMGPMYGHLEHRARQLGLGYAVRLLGHVDGSHLTRLVRAAEVLVLPSRYRVPQDDAVVDLARRAGRPVVTTHGGPAHLVRHEENGILTYDNPGSIVWALDRVLGDASHAERMGRNGRHSDVCPIDWNEVARRYTELCAQNFPELVQAGE